MNVCEREFDLSQWRAGKPRPYGFGACGGHQSVIHLHRLSDDWTALQEKVIDFMEQFKDGSQELLHYVGLLPN